MIWMFERAGKKNPNNEKVQFWLGGTLQQHNQPIELNSVTIMRQKSDYLHENPVKAGFVRNAEDWIYSSAVDYYTNNRKGLIEDLTLIE